MLACLSTSVCLANQIHLDRRWLNSDRMNETLEQQAVVLSQQNLFNWASVTKMRYSSFGERFRWTTTTATTGETMAHWPRNTIVCLIGFGCLCVKSAVIAPLRNQMRRMRRMKGGGRFVISEPCG